MVIKISSCYIHHNCDSMSAKNPKTISHVENDSSLISNIKIRGINDYLPQPDIRLITL